MECPICCFEIGKKIKITKCPSDTCQSTACTNCWKRWHLRDSLNSPQTYDPICMARCGFSWTHFFMVKKFSQKWLQGKYTFYRIEVCNKEFEVMLPMFRKRFAAEEQLEEIAIKQKNIREKAETLYRNLYNQYYKDKEEADPKYVKPHWGWSAPWTGFYTPGDDEDLLNEIPNIKENEKAQKISKRFSELNILRRNLKDFVDNPDITEEEIHDKIKEETTNIRLNLRVNGHCPKLECEGVLIGTWICKLCSSVLCDKCSMHKKDYHRCKKEDLLTKIQIDMDSKPCPKCRVPVFKVSGCDDMFCTQCHVFFSWRTLRIIRSHIPHNPHFAQMRDELGLPLDCVEIDMFNWNILQASFKGYNRYTTGGSLNIFLKILYHIVRELEGFTTEVINSSHEDEFKYRKKIARMYISKQINKKMRGITLWNYKVEKDLTMEINMVRQAWVNSIKAIISNFIDSKLSKSVDRGYKIGDFQNQIQILSKIARKGLVKITRNSDLLRKTPPIYPKDESRFKMTDDKKTINRVLSMYFITNTEKNTEMEDSTINV